jgi:uncharacterized repeat protein (TIGR01451 family)
LGSIRPKENGTVTMVWHQLMRHFHPATPRRAGKRNRRRLLVEQLVRRELLASDLGAIAGVAYVDEAADGSSVGDPPVLVDGSGDLVAPGTPGAQGIQVQLFEDTNDDLIFDGGDLLVGTDVTDLNGDYRFDNLTAGRYFVQQQAVPQLVTPTFISVDVTVANGIQTALIDDYSITTQSVTATAATPTATDSATAPEAIGGARDIVVTNTAGIGQLTVFADDVTDTLSIGSLGDATGTALLQYDGADGTTVLDATGLGGVALAGGAPGSTLDPGAGLIVQTRAENAGDTLFITVYTDAANSSTTSIPIPMDALAFNEIFVLFSDFVTATGAGADFNDVGAIEASVGMSANNDVFVSIVEARAPDTVQTDLANILPVSLGGQLFVDNDPGGGQNNGIRELTEAGVVGVTVELYQLAAPTDVVDPTTTTPLTTTVTGAGGTYSFSGLTPGHYAAIVPNSEFQPAATLFGFTTSTGNDPPTDPDDNIDDDDEGTTLANGDVASGTITLVSNNEPIDDDDTDPNTNTTLDFGFIPQIDLSVTKSLNVAGSNLVAGGNAVFDIVVQNAGPLDATNVVFQDVIPAGLSFDGIANPSGSFTTNVNGSTVDVLLGTLAAGGASATFQVLVNINANQTTDVTNIGTVSGDQVDSDPLNNSESELLDLIESDLSIVKSEAPDPVNAGNQLVYTITVTNDGPDAAAGVVVVDPLPADVTYLSADVDGDTGLVFYNSTTNELSASIGTLADQAVSVVTITVQVVDNAASPLSNAATVTADPDTDPDPSNNSASADTTVDRLVDLDVDKTVTGTPIAGQDVTYTILVTNTGPSEARGVTVVDTLAAGLTLVGGSFAPGTSGATITQIGQDLTFDIPDLGGGSDAEFSFDVSIATSAFGNIANTATAATTDPDNDSTNDADTVIIDVERRINLLLDKSVDLTTAVPGQDQLVYTIVVSHDTDSISDAGTVVVTDVIPAGLVGTMVDAQTADDIDFSNNTVTVTYDAIPIGETRTFTITGDVDEAATGTITNSASVASVGTELDPDSNTNDDATTLAPDFDVSLTKSPDVATPRPTDTVTYTVDVTNSGPSSAPGVILSDDIPTGLTFVSGTMGSDNATSDGTTVTFPAITIDSGATSSATLIFTVDALAVGLITNTAMVPDLSAAGENDVTNNSATADITVIPEADLGVSQTVSLDEAIVGSDLTYTITVINNGPSLATNVVATDTLPAGVTFVSGTGPNGEDLTETGGVVNVSGGDLAGAGSFSFTINGTVAAGASGIQTNTAIVSSDITDPVPGNDSSTADTAIDPQTSSISGLTFVDVNNNGIQDSGDEGIAGVVITLTGTDFLGNTVDATITTDVNGNYEFDGLARGTYNVEQTQPAGFRNGMTIPGTGANATVTDNVFSELGLGTDTDATGWNFAELNEPLSKRRFLSSPHVVTSIGNS